MRTNANDWLKTSAWNRCPVCDHTDWCTLSADKSAALCMRIAEGAMKEVDCGSAGTGFLHILTRNRFEADKIRAKHTTEDDQKRPHLADETRRDQVYRILLANLMLSESDREKLEARGFSAEEIKLGEYRSIVPHGRAELADFVRRDSSLTSEQLLTIPGFRYSQRGEGREMVFACDAGLLVPVINVDGKIVALRVRLQDPPPGTPKYKWISSRPSGPSPGSPLYVPPITPDASHRTTLRITEGEIKAMIATLRNGVLTVGCPGVGAWRQAIEFARARGFFTIRLAFDADWQSNEQVARSLIQCARRVIGLGLSLEVETWAKHKGIDDAIAAGEPVECRADADAVNLIVSAATRWHVGTPVEPDDMRGWANYYATKPEEAYVTDAQFVNALGKAREQDPPRLYQIRALFKDARFALGSFDELAKSAARLAVKNGNGHSNGKSAANGQAQRKRIEVTPDEQHVGDETIEAISKDLEVFARDGMLVRIGRQLYEREDEHGILIEPGTPRIEPLPPPRLRSICSARCYFFRHEANGEDKQIHVPKWLVEDIQSRGDWQGIRPLTAVAEAPTLRPDGTVVAEAGYDRATGIFVALRGEFPAIPENPTLDDAKAAYARINRYVAQFPFAGPADKAAWFAALLTVVARSSIRGPVPLFVFDANAAGAGKTKLADLIGVISNGRPMAKSGYVEKPEEFEKKLFSIALAALPSLLFDNVRTGGAIGGSEIDRFVTATRIEGRILGQSRTCELPWHTVMFATGNNLTTAADAQRRCIFSRLDVQAERPEDRSFEISDLIPAAAANRPALLCAALTMLRAWHIADKTHVEALPPLGSFEQWGHGPRAAVKWILGVDPLATREARVDTDYDLGVLRALLAAWARHPGGGSPEGIGCAELLKDLAIDGGGQIRDDLVNALAELRSGGKDQLPNPRSLGKYLAKVRGRVVDAMRFDCVRDTHNKSLRWKVEQLNVR